MFRLPWKPYVHASAAKPKQRLVVSLFDISNADIAKANRARRRARPLSLREREVMSLVCAGVSYKDIGARLGMTKGTVSRNTTRAKLKLGAATLEQAAAVYAASLVVNAPKDEHV